MNGSRTYAIRSLMVITFFVTALVLLVNAGLYFGLKYLVLVLASGSDAAIVIPALNVKIIIQSLSDLVLSLNLLLDNFFVWLVPGVTLTLFVCASLLWMVMKWTLSSLFLQSATSTASVQLEIKQPGKENKKKDHADQRMEQERKRRLFLHFLSVLQREGRLLDFFGEELDLYDDEQIGAAVRSIQEDCKKAMEKYLAPAPVIDQEEGENVDIAPGFDPDAIKLIGNVSGNPPFRGVLRHRGWKAGKKEVPKLSDVFDSSIITPAEVEIE